MTDRIRGQLRKHMLCYRAVRHHENHD